MIVKLCTTDAKWSAKHAIRVETLDNGNTFAIVEIADDSVERLTFGPKNAQMIRFDMTQIAKTLPRDWYNKAAMIPTTHIVSV